MNIALFEDDGYERLLPLTWLRACFELRCGCDRLLDKVRRHVGPHVARVWVRDAVRDVVEARFTPDAADPNAPWCLLNARTLLTGPIELPPPGTAWHCGDELIAASLRPSEFAALTPNFLQNAERRAVWIAERRVMEAPEGAHLMRYPWDLILASENELRRQCQSGPGQLGQVYPGAHLVQASQIHVGPGARVKPGAVLDAEDGPIWIDEHVLIEPNAVVQGPCYIGPRSVVRPGAAVRPGTSIGPVCKVGGEIEGSILHGYSNKQHDGFLGHSYVAEWVNLGADTVTSDLKNTYGTIRVALNGVPVESGQHFIGSIIGDHSKTGIGTILPTGGVIGVAANVFTQGAVPKFVPSFAWLTDEGLTNYRVDKAVQIARTVMSRRDVELSAAEQRLLEHVAAEAQTQEAAGWK
jgi:UDP-N-acetylglucosamine diphosphorylase/glucosamine-1-phosphate N-acetyltransferase